MESIEILRKIAMEHDYQITVNNIRPFGVLMNERTRKNLDRACRSNGMKTSSRSKVFGLNVYTINDLEDYKFLFVIEG